MSVISLEEWRKKQEELSTSNSQSKQNFPLEQLGATPTDDCDLENDLEQLMAFWIVLDKASREPFTVKSNIARKAAWHIAVCASRGLITTEVDYEMFSNQWMITEEGLDFKDGLDERIEQLM
jgi:hypothetical protein